MTTSSSTTLKNKLKKKILKPTNIKVNHASSSSSSSLKKNQKSMFNPKVLKSKQKVYGKKALLKLANTNPHEITLSTFTSSEEEEEESMEEEDSQKNVTTPTTNSSSDVVTKTKKKPPTKTNQKVLVCASRGITHRFRHFLSDVLLLLPHSYKENKLDTKKQLDTLNELADLANCNKILYLESKHLNDQYLWMSNAPNGPSVKFEVTNIHTMDELNMIGNHLKYSRSLLSFDAHFDTVPHLKLIKHLLMQIFNVPSYTTHSKPFFDHILTFTYMDQGIWLRNYQLPNPTLIRPNALTASASSSLSQRKDFQKKKDKEEEEEEKNQVHVEEDHEQWLEVGPRCVLFPIMIFQGSFHGLCLWKRSDYLTPAARRRLHQFELLHQQVNKVETKLASHERKKETQGVGEDKIAKEVFGFQP